MNPSDNDNNNDLLLPFDADAAASEEFEFWRDAIGQEPFVTSVSFVDPDSVASFGSSDDRCVRAEIRLSSFAMFFHEFVTGRFDGLENICDIIHGFDDQTKADIFPWLRVERLFKDALGKCSLRQGNVVSTSEPAIVRTKELIDHLFRAFPMQMHNVDILHNFVQSVSSQTVHDMYFSVYGVENHFPEHGFPAEVVESCVPRFLSVCAHLFGKMYALRGRIDAASFVATYNADWRLFFPAQYNLNFLVSQSRHVFIMLLYSKLLYIIEDTDGQRALFSEIERLAMYIL